MGSAAAEPGAIQAQAGRPAVERYAPKDLPTPPWAGTGQFFLRFVNATARPVDVYWRDISGVEIFAGSLTAGATFRQLTGIRRPWLVRDAATGAALVGFVVYEPPMGWIKQQEAIITETATTIPEPISTTLLATGLALLGGHGLRRRRAREAQRPH
jgi:hypothetical protein